MRILVEIRKSNHNLKKQPQISTQKKIENDKHLKTQVPEPKGTNKNWVPHESDQAF